MIKGYAGRTLTVDLRTRSFAFGPLDEDIARAENAERSDMRGRPADYTSREMR